MILVAIGGTGWPVKFYQGFQAFFFCICFHFISKYVSFECLGGFFCYDHEGRLGGQSNSTEVFKHFFCLFFSSKLVPFEYLGGFFCYNREGRPGGSRGKAGWPLASQILSRFSSIFLHLFSFDFEIGSI